MRRGLSNWPRALRVLAALSGPSPDPEAGLLASQMDAADWEAFKELAIKRHRVAPVIADRLSLIAPPTDVSQAIATAVAASGRMTLRKLHEVRRISEAFARVDATPMVMKGWPLAERLYGTAARRQGRDLDLYVPANRIAGCHAVMTKLGYVATPEHAQRARLIGNPVLLSECNDIEYSHSEHGLVVEILWRAHPVRGYPDLFETPWATTWQDTDIGRIKVPTERADMIYLSVHGSMHMWSRLKWLADISRLAQRRGGAALEDDLKCAREADAWSPVALGLVLSHRIFASPLPPSLADPSARLSATADRVMRRMALSDRALETFSARLGFYRLGIGLADTLEQRLGYVRFGIWRRIRLGLAELAPRVTGHRSGA